MGGVTPGIGAAIGIPIALVIVLIVGPGGYYYRRRKRRQIEEARKLESRSADVLEAGEDYYGGVKPQLDDTAVSPETAWRTSKSTIDDRQVPVSELAEGQQRPPQAAGLTIELIHPSVLRPGRKGPKFQELDVSNDDRRPELPAMASPPAAELRVDKSPPVESITEKEIQPLTAPVESKEEFARSDESMTLPALPGPILPPKKL